MSQVLVNDTLQEWQATTTYWTKHHNTIRTMFAPLTRALIKQAHIVQGQSVLDVAGVQVNLHSLSRKPLDRWAS